MSKYGSEFAIDELRNYRPQLTNKPENFTGFWDNEKYNLENIRPKVELEWRDYPVPSVEVADIKFGSWDKTPLYEIFLKPKSAISFPLIFNFHGYTGSRGLPADYLKWLTLGVGVISFDVRGQGDSPDFPYNITKLGVMGGSQGGGLAISAAGLESSVEFLIADCPFISHFEKALEIAVSGPYMEIADYFKWNDPECDKYNEVLKTLGYIDSVHFCQKIKCATLMAVGLKDTVTPPLTVFAAFNHIQSVEKQIKVYPQFGHELNPFHEEKKLAFVANIIGR